ncbi:MAG TPA: ABC transporter ATP-binding protein [Thermodesulfobacteriota bacterium]|nr:ABC transporter ATP-binding protein [Thermodesulfobacteriota bacterium]
MSLLDAEKIDVYYGDVQALREVSLKAEEGKIASIVGGNGAGKTTTIRTLSGLLKPSSGAIRFLAQDVTLFPPHRRVELGMIQIPEARRLFPYMTVSGNLDMGSYTARARKEKEKVRKEIFDLFPVLQERKNQMAHTLSGGEQQMLAIGRGLMARPTLLMLDEPSLGLAPIVVRMIFQTVLRINAQGITILLVEQNVKQCLEISNQSYVLENGRVVLHGTGGEVLKNEHLRKAYLGL